MKFAVSTKKLTEALKKIKPAIPRDSVLSTLECVKVDINKDSISITGGNLEMYITARLSGESGDAFSFLVEHKQLLRLADSLPLTQMVVEFNEVNQKLFIESGDTQFEISTENISDYPALPIVDEVLTTKELTKRFTDDCVSALRFVSNDTLRPAMTGVFFDYSGKNLKIVATDAHALFVSDKYEGESPNSYIVPANCLKSILSIAKKTSGTLSFGASHAIFANDDTSVVIKLIDVNFPQYQAVIPQHKGYFSVNKNALVAALKTMLPFSNPATKKIYFELGENLKIEASDEDFGLSSTKSIEYKSKTAEDFYFAFNGEYLINALEQFNSDSVKILNDGNPNKAFIINGIDSNNTVLIMPLNVDKAA